MSKSSKYWIHCAIMFIITFGIGALPPFGGDITPLGMDVLGVFLGVLYCLLYTSIPSEEALFVEPTENNPWVNIFACRTADKDNENFKKLISIYQSDEIKAFIAETYPGDAVLAAW